MSDLRSIKQRMGAIRNTKKIADAMKMVSTAKYWRLLDQLRTVRIVVEQLDGFGIPGLPRHAWMPPNPKEPASPEVKTPPSGEHLVLVFLPFRGMCGPLTQNLLTSLMAWYPEPCDATFAVFGKKGLSTFRNLSKKTTEVPGPSMENLRKEDISELANFCAKGVQTERFDRIEGVGARFHNMLRQTPERFLMWPPPLPPDWEDLDVDPDPETVCKRLLPLYFECHLRHFFLESMVSEHGSRMAAMDNASNNAQELLDKFRLEYNKIRQSKITLELMEIISGSEAVQ